MMWIKNAEDLRPCVAVQSEADIETRGWDCLPPTAQRIILEASATNGLTILSEMPLSIHRLLKARNATDIQADCTITFTGHNIYLPTSFC